MKLNLSKHLNPIVKSLIVAVGLLTTTLALLLLGEVRDRSELVAPAATPIYTDRYGTFLAEGTRDENAPLGFWDPPDTLPQRIVSCLLVIEDKRYYEHLGVDLRSLLRALVNNLSGKPRQGASTIAMQVARLQRPGKRTLWRKVCEMGTAVWLNRKYGHENVLRHYLKIAPQGNRIHGVAYAARRYFQKPLADLSWAEAAVLASLPRAPGRMNLYRPEGRQEAFKRANLILNLLHENRTLDEKILAISQRQLNSLKIPVKESRPPPQLSRHSASTGISGRSGLLYETDIYHSGSSHSEGCGQHRGGSHAGTPAARRGQSGYHRNGERDRCDPELSGLRSVRRSRLRRCHQLCHNPTFRGQYPQALHLRLRSGNRGVLSRQRLGRSTVPPLLSRRTV